MFSSKFAFFMLLKYIITSKNTYIIYDYFNLIKQMQGRKKIKKVEKRNQEQKSYRSPLINEDYDYNYELQRAPLKRERDHKLEMEERISERQSLRKYMQELKPAQAKLFPTNQEYRRPTVQSQMESQLQSLREAQDPRCTDTSRRYNYTPNISMFQTMLKMFEPSKYQEQDFCHHNVNSQSNPTSNLKVLKNFSLDMALIQGQQIAKVQLNQKTQRITENNAIENNQEKDDQYGHPRHMGTLKRNSEISKRKEERVKNNERTLIGRPLFSESKNNLDQQILPNFTFGKQTIGYQNPSIPALPIQSHSPVVSLSLSSSPQFLLNTPISVSSSPSTTVPLASNLSPLKTLTAQTNDNLSLKTATFGNLPLQIKKQVQDQRSKKNLICEASSSMSPQTFLQNLNINSEHVSLQQQWALQNFLFHLTSNNQNQVSQKNHNQLKCKQNKFRLLQNVGILPNILPEKRHQTKSTPFYSNEINHSSTLQFQQSIRKIKTIYDQLPIIYSFDPIGSLKIKDLKNYHKYFAFLIRNIQLIRTKLSQILSHKYQTGLKHRQISSKGMEKLIDLKKKYLFQNQAKNGLFQSAKTLDIVYNQVRIIDPVTQAYLYHKEYSFFNPDQGVILLGSFIRQKYRQLYKQYTESIKILQNQQKIQINFSQILEEEIELVYMNASNLAVLQKKIKKLKKIISFRQEEKLNMMFQNKINKEMDEEWRDLNIFFELGTIFESKLKRGRQSVV